MTRRLRFGLVFILFIAITALFWYLWQVKQGKIQLSAHSEFCQNQAQIQAMYGRSQWMVGANLVPVKFQGKEVRFHQLAAPWLKKVDKKITGAKIKYDFHTAETFNWRTKTAGIGQSLHSYGIAIDINPGQNPYNFRGQLVTDLPRKVIDIFKDHGFYWGGDWKGFRDPMHFEWYGAEIRGRLFNKYTKEPIKNSSVYVDEELLTKISGDFSFAISEGRHLITITNDQYQDYKFKIKVACNQIIARDIVMEPIPSGVPGTIRGRVVLPKESPLVLPADIYLNGVYVTKTDLNGNYVIGDALGEVVHLIEVRLMPIFTGATKVMVRSGEVVRNVNIQLAPIIIER